MPPYHRHRCHQNPPEPGTFKGHADDIVRAIRRVFGRPDLDVEVRYELAPMAEVAFELDHGDYDRGYGDVVRALESPDIHMDVVEVQTLFDPGERDKLEIKLGDDAQRAA